MTNFYISRHGQTENNLNRRFSGWIDTPLTEEGVRNAQASAAKLVDVKLDLIVASDLGRAFTTAYIIARKLGYTEDIQRLKALREVNYGDYANQPYEAYPEMSAVENADFVSPNGESLNQMQARVIDCLVELDARNHGESILLVAHDGTINAIRAAFNQDSIGIADLTHNAHDFVANFRFEAGEVVSFIEL